MAHESACEPPMTDVEVKKLVIDGAEVLLCSRGGNGFGAPSLNRAATGCRRILRTC